MPARLRHHVDVLPRIALQIEQNRRIRFGRGAPLVQLAGVGLGIKPANQLVAAVVHHTPAPRPLRTASRCFPVLPSSKPFSDRLSMSAGLGADAYSRNVAARSM